MTNMRECLIELDIILCQKNNISDVHFHKYIKSKTNSDDDLPLEKAVNMFNAVLLINSVFNKNHNYYYYKCF